MTIRGKKVLGAILKQAEVQRSAQRAVPITLRISEEIDKELAEIAKEQGFDNRQGYIISLINSALKKRRDG